MWVDALLWLVLVTGLGLAAFPLAARLFHGWGDAGSGVARTLGLLVVGWISWLLASTGLLPQKGWTILLVLGLVGAAAWLGGWRRDAVAALRERRGGIAAGEAVFLVSFVVFYLAFVQRPYPHLGERPMDLAFFSACWRAETFPPADPWFAGRPLNYYYFGHAASAMLAKVTGLTPPVAYPLAVALIPALFLSCAFSLLRRLLDRTGLAAAATGILLLMGNLYLLVEGGFLHAAFDMHAFLRSVQVIPGGLNEYPFFSFLVAELHAHVLALPLEILVLCIILAGMRERLAAGVTALALGALAATNTWSVAVFAPIVLLGLLRQAAPEGGGRALIRAALQWAGILAAGAILFLPFHLGHDPYPVSPERLGETTTRIGHLGLLFGLPLFVILPSLIARARLYLVPRISGMGQSRKVLAVGAIAFLGVISIQSGLPALLLLPILCVAAPLGLGAAEDPREGFLWSLFLMGIALIYGCEILNVRGFLSEPDHRYNTIMRFHFGATLLLGIVATDRLVRGVRRTLQTRRAWPEKVWLVASVLLVVLSATPPARATLAYIFSGSGGAGASVLTGPGHPDPGEVEAIRWLNREVRGQPVLLESTGRSYDFRACRISSHTGLPTILGWVEKQVEWNRKARHVGERGKDLTLIFGPSSLEEVMPVLRRRNVRYVFIGPWERASFPAEGIAKFDPLPIVFQSGDTRIVEVPSP